jgi:hypothetical protein
VKFPSESNEFGVPKTNTKEQFKLATTDMHLLAMRMNINICAYCMLKFKIKTST